MTTFKRACAVAALACLFALTPRAGDMSAGSAGPPRPTPTPKPAVTRGPDEPNPPDFQPTAEDDADGLFMEAVLSLLQSMFVVL